MSTLFRDILFLYKLANQLPQKLLLDIISLSDPLFSKRKRQHSGIKEEKV